MTATPASLPNFPSWIYFRDGSACIVRDLEDFHRKACHYDIHSDEWIPKEWADTPDKFKDEPVEVLPFVEKPVDAPKRGRPPKS